MERGASAEWRGERAQSGRFPKVETGRLARSEHFTSSQVTGRRPTRFLGNTRVTTIAFTSGPGAPALQIQNRLDYARFDRDGDAR